MMAKTIFLLFAIMIILFSSGCITSPDYQRVISRGLNSEISAHDQMDSDISLVAACHMEVRYDKAKSSIIGSNGGTGLKEGKRIPLYYTCYYRDGHNETSPIREFDEGDNIIGYVFYYYQGYKGMIYTVR